MRVDYNSLIDEKYESDSSEKIWTEYYKPFYSKIGWDFWKIFDYEELEYELVNEKKRYYAKCREESAKYGKTFLTCELGGELDFNFNSNPNPKMWREAKYEYYKKLINDKMINTDKDRAKQRLFQILCNFYLPFSLSRCC